VPVTDAFANRPTTLADYLAIVRRRKWIILLPLLVAPAMAFILTSRQTPLYSASAEIYVKRADIAAAVAGVTDPTLQVDPVRFLNTQASVAGDPKLARRVVAVAGVRGMSAGALLGSSSVTPNPDADLLNIAVTDGNPDAAVRLANAYASEFTKYRTELDTARINDALDGVKARIKSLRAHGVSIDSASYATLLDSQTRLETVGKLLADNTYILRPAEGAGKVSPRPKRNGIIGFILGGILGIGLAFAAEALDKRVRSEREIADALRLPLLGRVPRPSRRLRKANSLAMLAEPRTLAAEPLRALRTNLEFANLERDARTVMITSAVQREGKSTTIANLAVALVRSGRRVALVDLDLRRPFLHRFFRIRSTPGATDVLLGRSKLSDAMRPVPVAAVGGSRSGPPPTEVRVAPSSNSSNGHGQLDGVLNVLPAGTIPPDPGELIGTESLGSLLDALRDQFDFVLIDAPPLLVVGDAMTLSARVDAMFAVTRLKVVHRGMLHELARLLEACPAEKFGYVVTSAELGESYAYAYAYGYAQTEPEHVEKQRAS
jgi:succinoglycan biosynthesis transport protein ExoP